MIVEQETIQPYTNEELEEIRKDVIEDLDHENKWRIIVPGTYRVARLLATIDELQEYVLELENNIGSLHENMDW